MKLPPVEKIPEAYSAIVDGRVKMSDNSASASVVSSDGAKEYLVQWDGDKFYSNDNATYWQSYPGYPVLAVLMELDRLPYDEAAASYFKDVDWHDLNARNKRDYARSVEDVIGVLSPEVKESIHSAIESAFDQLKTLDLTFTRKKLF